MDDMCYPKHTPSLTFTTWQLTDFDVRAKTDESMIPSHQETSRSLHQEHWQVGPCAVQWPFQTARDHCGINEFCWLHQWHRKKALVVFRGVRSPNLWNTNLQSGWSWGRHISAKPDSVDSVRYRILPWKDKDLFIYDFKAMITIPFQQPVERDDIISNHARLQKWIGKSSATWP